MFAHTSLRERLQSQRLSSLARLRKHKVRTLDVRVRCLELTNINTALTMCTPRCTESRTNIYHLHTPAFIYSAWKAPMPLSADALARARANVYRVGNTRPRKHNRRYSFPAPRSLSPRDKRRFLSEARRHLTDVSSLKCLFFAEKILIYFVPRRTIPAREV